MHNYVSRIVSILRKCDVSRNKCPCTNSYNYTITTTATTTACLKKLWQVIFCSLCIK